MLSAMGMEVQDIAKFVDLSETTLRKHYEREIELGRLEANMKVAASLFKQATDEKKPVVAAAIYWMKTRAGWREDGPKAPTLPAAPAPEPLGKKDQANLDAQTAHVGSDWEELLRKPPGAPVQ